MKRAAATTIGKVVISSVIWYVPHYTPSVGQEAIVSKQVLSKAPTETNFIERSVFMEEANTENQWTFGTVSHERVNVLI